MRKNTDTSMTTIALSNNTREIVKAIKYKYNTRSINDAVNKALIFMSENDPRISEMLKK